MHSYDIFLVAPPGLEHILAAEARDLGFAPAHPVPGGVEINGPLSDIPRANRHLRGAARVLLRVASFRVMHLAQLDKRARKVDWANLLRPGVPFHVEAVCRKSKIYHNRAAAQRIAAAISAAVDSPVQADAPVKIKARIDDDLCTISIDTSGEALHKRGHKGGMGKAPIRENLAALCLRALDFDPSRPLVDPMCGSGTFPLEAADIAAGLIPGRTRSFAFEHLNIPDMPLHGPTSPPAQMRFFGFDRDQGAIQTCRKNADMAGVADWTAFTCQPLSDLHPPEGFAGLVMINPPYGGRIGQKKQLYGLYGAFGTIMKDRFKGWRVGMVTPDAALAKATNLPWADPIGPFPNGGLRVSLYHAQL